MSTSNQASDFDDFPVSGYGSESAMDFYEVYLKSVQLAAEIPKRKGGASEEKILRSLVKEVQASSARNGALFRRNADAKEALSTLWISGARQIARSFVAATQEMPLFNGISADQIGAIARMSVDENVLPQLPSILATYGIVLIFEPSFPGMKVDGAVFKLSTGNPVIVLSLRYSRLDNFWFTLMHELAHVALHYETLNEPILDDLEETSSILIEKQADKLGGESLISKSDWRSCDARYTPTDANVIAFAKKVKVHPSIVAGRLRRDLNRHTLFTDIINKLNVRKVLFNEE